MTGSGGTPAFLIQILDGHGIEGQAITEASVGQKITMDVLLKDTGSNDSWIITNSGKLRFFNDGDENSKALFNIRVIS